MTKEQILKKAIEKAVKNGWDASKIFTTDSVNDLEYGSEEVYELDEVHHYTRFIFSHDFAKAFWGEEAVCDCCGELLSAEKDGQVIRFYSKCKHEQRYEIPIMRYRFHLQEMVLEEDPIKYLEKFL